MGETANRNTLGSIVWRDPAVSIMVCVTVLVLVFDVTAIALFAHSRDAEVLKAMLLLTGAYAVAGIVLGFMRGLRSGSAIKRRRA